nr:DUF3899 domain-containing protein [Polycladospora coralii]
MLITWLASDFNPLIFANYIFLLGLLFLVFAGFFYVVHGGFFTIFKKSWRMLMSKKKESFQEQADTEWMSPLIIIFFVCGLLFCFSSLFFYMD